MFQNSVPLQNPIAFHNSVTEDTSTAGAIFSSSTLSESKRRVDRFSFIAGRVMARGVQRGVSSTHGDVRCMCLSTPEATPLTRCEAWDPAQVLPGV